MTPRLVGILAAVAAVSVIGAVVSYRANNVVVVQDGVGEKVIAGLSDKVNSVISILVEQGTDKLELVNREGRWQIKTTGYPVSPAKVKKALVGLVNLSKLEAKTANEKKYLLIDVDAPGKKDGRGRQLTLSDKAGKQLAKIILGKTAAGKAGPGRDAQYVRLANDKTSWLALGAVDATPALPSWVEPRFLKLNVDSVTYGRIETDGKKLEVRRTGKDGNGSSIFEMLDVPEGRKTRTSTTIKFAATDLANLDLVDVRPYKPGSTPSSKAFIETDTGLKIAFELVEEGKKGWVGLQVVEKGSDVKAADAIIAATKGWQFLIADYKKAAFKKTPESLLYKKE